MTETAQSPDGTPIAFDRYGEGPPVVLVGGLFQHRAIDSQTARLAQLIADAGCSVAHYDRRGRGDSGDTKPWAVEREIEDLQAVADALGGGPAGFFGMSSGGALVLEAVAAGMPARSLAVYEVPLHVAEAPPSPPTLAADIEAALADGRPGDAVGVMLGPIIGEEAFAGFRHAPVFGLFEAVAPTMLYDTHLLDGLDRDGVADPSRWAGVAAPVLVMAGGASDAWWRAAAQAIVDAVPDGRLEVLEGQTHEVDVELLAPRLAAHLA